jgi:hypothetical protein
MWDNNRDFTKPKGIQDRTTLRGPQMAVKRLALETDVGPQLQETAAGVLCQEYRMEIN